MLIITPHAHQRFLERFPDVPVCLTERVEKAILFGGQAGNENEMRLDTEYDVVYVLTKNYETNDVYLQTVLTKDQALANFAIKSDMYAWRACQIEPKKIDRFNQNATYVEVAVSVKDKLEKLAETYASQYNYYFPPKEEKKFINNQLRTEHEYTISAIDKYFWPKLGQIIYAYNASHRIVAPDAE